MESRGLSYSDRTLSLQLIADPIVKQINELDKVIHSKRGVGFPDVVSASTDIREAVCKLHQVALEEISRSQDKVDMPLACNATLKASEQLVDAARRLRDQPHSRQGKKLFFSAAQGVQSGLVQVLLHWDNAQVLRICEAAQMARDRLQVMGGSQSMRGLLLCFKSYAESMKELLFLVDKRQKELVNKEKKQRLLQSLDKMKHTLPKFSSAMQNHVRTHSPSTKEAKTKICEEITSALDDLVTAVREEGVVGGYRGGRGPRSSMARTIETVKSKLGASKRYSIGPELDRHIDAIIENSKAVAHVSRDDYREIILKECGEVLTLRKELGRHFEAVSADPGSTRAKRAFDKCAKKLCEKLNELDRWVADSVVDQVTDVFVEASGPLNHLVQAATGTQARTPPPRMMPTPPTSTSTPVPPPSSARVTPTTTTSPRREEVDTGPGPVAEDTKKIAEVFRRHSRRLSQVAAHAAQSSTDTERIKLIKELAEAIDELTYVVVEKAEHVNRHPADRKAKEELDKLRQKWARKVQELTRVIDDIIDPEDFMAQSEANIQQDMEKCKAALREGRWEELRTLVLAIAAKARRAQEVGETAVSKASDRSYRATLSSAVTRLERAIPKIVPAANRVIEQPSSRERQEHFLNSLQELLGSLQNIQLVLGTEIDITSEEEEDLSTPSPSLHHHQPSPPPRGSLSPHKQRATAEERMTRRNVRRVQNKPQYIGRLGGSRPRSRELQSFEEQDASESFQDISFSSEALSRSFDSSTQTMPPRQKTQSSQVDGRFLSTNATYGSSASPNPQLFSPNSSTSTSPNPQLFSPNSSTSTWKTPLTPVPPVSPLGHTPQTPETQDPPLSPPSYPAPSPPSHSPPLSPRRAAPPSPTDVAVGSYVSPFQKLAAAARQGDQQELQGHAANLSARVIRLTEMADSAASTLDRNSDLVKVIQTKSSEVAKLTPRILDHASQLSRNPQRQREREEFQAVTHQWAGNVRDLINAMQQANLPWSRRARQLVSAAENKEGLDLEMEHISTQTRKMVDVATMAVEAAMTEEAIGGDAGDPDVSVDKELQEEVRLVRTRMAEIEKLTPQLLGAAEMAAGQSADSATSEHLHLLAEEWATKAKMLMKGVDDITLGMGGAADTLFLSAKSGDEGLQKQQSQAIKDLASSLHTIAKEALEGCSDEEKVRVVCVVGKQIEKLSTRLIECANTVAEAVNTVAEAVEEEEEELSQTVQENTEILRRDWSAQVHLLTAHIDDLTTEASAPLDRLVDISLQANRTNSLQTKKLLMKRFEVKANFLMEQLGLVESLFEDATGLLPKPEQAIRNSRVAIGFLRKLSPHAVAAAKSLESEAGSAVLEHFNHLRRQWAAKAQFLLGNLRKTGTANVDEVIDAFMDLLHSSCPPPPPEWPDNLSVSSQSGSTLTPAMQRSYSSEVLGDTTPVTRFDFDESDFKAPSTPMMDTRPKKKQQFPTLAEMGLKPVPPRVKRPTSMSVLPSWASVQDTAGDTSSAESIALAAQSLRELTDQFMEENNPMVSVGKKMSEQMSQMAEFARGKGELRDKTDMILTAKAVAANGQTIHRIANVISRQCEDSRSRNNLLCCAEMIPTLSTQLTILASVKTSTPDDSSADIMLVKNAQNLMQAVIKTVQAAEAACIKEPKPVMSESMGEGEDQEAMELAMSWKRKLYVQRAKETINAPRGARGLRKLNKFRISTPSVVDVIRPSEEHMKSPTKH